MPNRFGKLKLLTLKSKDEEFLDAFDGYVDNRNGVAYDKAKLLYQIKENKKQNKINRSFVIATWIMALATWALALVTIYTYNFGQ